MLMYWYCSQPKPVEEKWHGKRVHCWVMVLPGGRDVDHPIFAGMGAGNFCPSNFVLWLSRISITITVTVIITIIHHHQQPWCQWCQISTFWWQNFVFCCVLCDAEASTGKVFTQDSNYLGIESVWNGTNYWANIHNVHQPLEVIIIHHHNHHHHHTNVMIIKNMITDISSVSIIIIICITTVRTTIIT